jgi:transposase
LSVVIVERATTLASRAYDADEHRSTRALRQPRSMRRERTSSLPLAGPGSIAIRLVLEGGHFMRKLLMAGSGLAASVVVLYGPAVAKEPKIAPGCEKIVAVLDAGGGGLSADEVAKRTNTDVETVRGCTDQWRSTMKDKAAPKGAQTTHQDMPARCAKIVAVLDQNAALSADEVAKKTGAKVGTVRDCTDRWRRTMPQ